MTQATTLRNRQNRKKRTRSRIRGTTERPRLHVYRSCKHIYSQIINDQKGNTLATASSKEIKKASKQTKTDIAAKVGSLLAEKCKKIKIIKVRFDRGANKYHGRVKALAEAAREAGLEF